MLYIDDAEKTEHLLAFDGAKERLHLFKANLLEEGCFDSVVDGCDGVFHTACPILQTSDNPQVNFFYVQRHNLFIYTHVFCVLHRIMGIRLLGE